MKKLSLILASSVLSGLLVLAAHQPPASALTSLVRVDAPSPSLLVEVDQKKKNNLFGLKKKLEDEIKKQKNDGGGDKSKANDDKPKAAKKKDKDKDKKKDKDQLAKTCGPKVNCDVGYIRLATPNKYGACCELPKTGMYGCTASVDGNVYDAFPAPFASESEARSSFLKSLAHTKVTPADVSCHKVD